MIHSGLKPYIKDKRDFSFHRNFGGITPIALPQEFDVDSGLTMPDQGADGLFEACTAYTQLELCTDQDGKVYNTYRDLYEKTLALENAPFGSGCDIKDSLKMTVAYYKRGGYFAIESSKLDWFDSICSVIYTNFIVNKIKCSVSIGTPWYKVWDTNSITSDGVVPQIFTGDPATLSWHNWKISSWKLINNVPYLRAKTWQGKGYGNAGWSFYSRETINAVMKINGTCAFTVAPRNGNEQTVKWTIIDMLKTFFTRFLDLHNRQNIVQLETQLDPVLDQIKTMPPTPSIPLWATRSQALHSSRVIMDTYNFTWNDKDILCAIIMQESGFNVCATGKRNSDGTYDYGLVQVNNKWWIGEGKMFKDITEVFLNPEKSIRFLCDSYKEGKLNRWSSYNSGAYKQYLNGAYTALCEHLDNTNPLKG